MASTSEGSSGSAPTLWRGLESPGITSAFAVVTLLLKRSGVDVTSGISSG